jgi:mannose/fructose-specific phosphotransferase system component IIA
VSGPAESGLSEKVAIVVAHGSLARGLVSAMEKVVGPQANVFCVSNTGLSPAALQAEIESLIAAKAADKDVYLLTDLRGGSCATTCLRSSSSRAARVRGVVYGANLTLLLEFIMHQDLPHAEFFQVLLAKARSSVDGVDLSERREGGAGEGEEQPQRRTTAVP